MSKKLALMFAFLLPIMAFSATELAGPAHADSVFITCPSGNSGIASTVTSCPFADNVRYAYFHQAGNEIVAYSPVTGQAYNMSCSSGISRMDTGQSMESYQCDGGAGASVVFW